MAPRSTGCSPDEVAPPSRLPSYVEDARLIRRRYVRIPKDQARMLESPTAWSGDLQKGQHSVVNVPPHVLQNLEEFHARLQSGSESAISHTQASPVLGSHGSARENRQSEAGHVSAESSHQHNGTDQASEEDEIMTQLSWSPSPRRSSLQGPVSQKASPRYPPSEPPSPAKRFIRPPVPSFPSSSIGSEGDLEMEVPAALYSHLQPVNKAAAALITGQTPPSAQVIPCSFNEKSSSPEKCPPGKRRKLMKRIKFDSSQADGDQQPQIPAPAIRLQPSRLQLEFKSSLPTSSLSINTPASQEQENQPVNTISKNSPVAAKNLDKPSPPTPVRRGSVVEQEHDMDVMNLQVSDKSPRGHHTTASAPFTAFKSAYPGFKGGLEDFVKACICANQLVQRRALASFLFDDFIRVFCEHYVHYIAGLDQLEGALTAIEWYNDNVEEASYNKGVVSRGNIEQVLAAYPDEVTAAEAAVRAMSIPPAAVADDNRPSPIEEIEVPMTFMTQPAFGQVKRKGTLERDGDGIVELPTGRKRRELADDIDVATIASLDEGERIPQTVLKTKATAPDAFSRPTAGAASEVAKPTISPTSSVRSRPRRSGENPEMRSRRFKQFMRRTMDSITSSRDSLPRSSMP